MNPQDHTREVVLRSNRGDVPYDLVAHSLHVSITGFEHGMVLDLWTVCLPNRPFSSDAGPSLSLKSSVQSDEQVSHQEGPSIRLLADECPKTCFAQRPAERAAQYRGE